MLRVIKGGLDHVSRKTVLSQFSEDKDIMKMTVYGELNIYFSFHGNYFCKITLYGYYGNHDSRGRY